MTLKDKKIGFAMTGSFCTFKAALVCLTEMVAQGASVTPIISTVVDTLDTRFNKADELKESLMRITGNEIIRSIPEAEPIGPKQLFDLVIILPATGNTIAKLANGITDTAVTMAAKSHLRNNRPVVIGVSTNDALGNGAKNIGALMNAKDIYFVPFAQDDPYKKTKSLVFRNEHVIEAMEWALDGKQVQPVLLSTRY